MLKNEIDPLDYNLFGELNKDIWKSTWGGMPEFIQEDKKPLRQILVSFETDEDIREFSRLLNKKITEKTRFMWYPESSKEKPSSFLYIDDKKLENKYPIYIISKGRSESRLTSKALEKMNIPYHIVIESQEYDKYAAVIDPKKILVLPFSNLGQGSIPARNWVWEYSISIGAEKHWILDDNISGFFRLNNNNRIKVHSAATFRAVEDFSDRYENVVISGMNYTFFAPDMAKVPPYRLNTRVYSCILIKNDIDIRWRGRYNEDTDLCIRALKEGYCTLLFMAFLCAKACTMTMKGGNTDELYKQNETMDGRLLMAQSLVDQHPDIVRVTEKWGRYQHHVDYSQFRRTKLKLKKGIIISDEVDNYGLRLIKNNIN